MRETLYGRQPVRESLRAARRTPYRLVLGDNLTQTDIIDEIVALAQSAKVPVTSMPRRDMDRLVSDAEHQGVILETSDYPYVDIYAMLDLAAAREEAPFLLLLDQVQDVRNLGGLVRTAEAVGVHGVVIQGRRSAGMTPAAVNASSGGAEHLLIAQVANLAQTIERLKEADIWVAGLEEDPRAQIYTQARLTGPLAIVVGSEGQGMRRLVRDRCDFMIIIPMKGKINSLNASIAGSLALYEALRQRD